MDHLEWSDENKDHLPGCPPRGPRHTQFRAMHQADILETLTSANNRDQVTPQHV